MTKPPVSSVARMESEEAGPDLVAVWEVHLADGVHVIGKKYYLFRGKIFVMFRVRARDDER